MNKCTGISGRWYSLSKGCEIPQNKW